MTTNTLDHQDVQHDDHTATDEVPDCASEAAGPRTFRIPQENLDDLRRTFERLNRRALKLGIAPITWTEGEPFPVPRDRDRLGAVISWTMAVPVTIEASPIVLDGWSLAAVLEPAEHGTLTRRVPGATLDLAPFRTVDATWCDHCRTSRRRTETFVVVHEGGDLKRVGRQCLKDFLGHESAAMLAGAAEHLLDAFALAEEAEERGAAGGGVVLPATLPFLAMVARMIRENGWVPRSSHSGATPTVERALLAYWSKDPRVREATKPTDDDIARAEVARAWALDTFGAKPVEERTDYEHNAWLSIRTEVVGRRQTGLAASVVAAHLRHLEQLKLQQASPPIDAWLATEGERVTFYGHLLLTKMIESAFSISTLHRIRTREGHTVVWFSTSEKLCDDQHERLFTAKVKRHDTRNGEKQTIVTRLVEARDDARQRLEAKIAKKAQPRVQRRKAA